MYSNGDLEAAVTAGVLTDESVKNFREYIEKLRNAPAEDEESFRLLSGFNDIFVAICLVMTLGAMQWLHAVFDEKSSGLSLGVLSWFLAEYFTRKRRMALPSILLLLFFVFAAGYTGMMFTLHLTDSKVTGFSIASIFAAVSAGVHWYRFKVPITVAIGAASVLAVVMRMLMTSLEISDANIYYFVFISGVILFSLAMRWDLSDLKRTTKRTDVAFWLHLIASPVLVHSLFEIMGVKHGSVSLKDAIVIVVLYVLFAVVALLIDRRALLVSSLIYVLYAANVIIENVQGTDVDRTVTLATTGVVIGAGLLLLSALWSKSRQFLLKIIPAKARNYLTTTGE